MRRNKLELPRHDHRIEDENFEAMQSSEDENHVQVSSGRERKYC